MSATVIIRNTSRTRLRDPSARVGMAELQPMVDAAHDDCLYVGVVKSPGWWWRYLGTRRVVEWAEVAWGYGLVLAYIHRTRPGCYVDLDYLSRMEVSAYAVTAPAVIRRALREIGMTMADHRVFQHFAAAGREYFRYTSESGTHRTRVSRKPRVTTATRNARIIRVREEG